MKRVGVGKLKTIGLVCWGDALAVCLAYVAVVFLLTPGNTVLGFPVHHDDFTNLATDINLSLRRPRFVSYFILSALSYLGPPVYYGCLHFLVLIYVFLTSFFIRFLFQAQEASSYLLAFVFGAVFGVESVVEYGKYTGLITNLLSATFAMSAICLLATTRQRLKRLPWGALILACWLFAMSFWSKEDFVIPSILAVGYYVWEGRRTPEGGRRWMLLLCGVSFLAALLMWHVGRVQNPFVTQVSVAYQAQFSPTSIGATALKYLSMSPVSVIAAVLQSFTLIGNVIAKSPLPWSGVLLINGMIAAMMLPYSCLPNHVAPYYNFIWVAWQLMAFLVALPRMAERLSAKAVVVVCSVLCILAGMPGRVRVANWYSRAGSVNRNILHTLKQSSSALEPYGTIVVDGAPLLGPWYGTSGAFLERQGFRQRWIVRVPGQSEYYRSLIRLLGRAENGKITTVPLEESVTPVDAPVLQLFPDGTGVFVFPGQLAGH